MPKANDKDNGYAWHYRYPTSYWSSKRALIDLRRFEMLARYYFGYASDMSNPAIPPLSQLIVEYDEQSDDGKLRRFDLIENNINKLIPVILAYFRHVQAPHNYTFKYHGETRHLDIILDIFVDADFCRQTRYEALMQELQRVEGWYEKSMQTSKLNFRNPLYWCAWILNLPISILALAGVNVESKNTSNLYYWFLQAMMGIIITLLIARLGMSDDIVRVVLKK